MKNINLILLAILSIAFAACEPQQDSAIELGAPPTQATFLVEETGVPNTYRFTNTTSETFIHQWDLGDENETTMEGDVIEFKYQDKGDYTVKLRAFNKAGFAEGVQNVSVAEDAPISCDPGSVYEFLTDCGAKTWKLNPDVGALWVGPNDGSGTVWWENDQSVVDLRTCLFDDEWTFTFDGLAMNYDTKGMIWGEGYMGFGDECVTTDQLVGAIKPWGDGDHTFEVNDGVNPPQLTVNGLGAFLGIPKAANGMEVSTPQSSVTYDIIEMSADGNQMTVEVDYSAGIWRFTLASF